MEKIIVPSEKNYATLGKMFVHFKTNVCDNFKELFILCEKNVRIVPKNISYHAKKNGWMCIWKNVEHLFEQDVYNKFLRKMWYCVFKNGKRILERF